MARKKNDASKPVFSSRCPLTPPLVAERAFDKDPSLYLLSLQQMIGNDFPIPSYMADIFGKPNGWVEIQPTSETVLLVPHE